MTDKKRCFVIMPFGEQGTDTYDRNLSIYQDMIRPVVEECGYKAIRADELEHMGSITRDIIEHLHESDLVVADLSGHNANVFYELGVRHALYRSGTVPIIRKGEPLPFDIANYKTLFYSIELKGPEIFRNGLKRRIKAFERLSIGKSDNPVHDILGDKLLNQKKLNEALKEKEAITKENERLKREQEAKNNQLKSITKEKETAEKTFLDEKAALEKRIQELEEENKSLKSKPPKPSPKESQTEPAQITPSVKLRSEPIDNLSNDEVTKMLKERDFFSTGKWGPENKQGKGLNHQYEVIEREGEKLVIDHTTGLTWQQSGSPDSMVYADALKWIEELNRKKFGGYNDWRLPTLEEAMSLMETEEKNGDLYISEVFDKTQSWIWTSDKSGSSAAWVVGFYDGYCDLHRVDSSEHVRAVR